ncbi:MAG TPA: phenylalanine--tRNA ligase subunit beta, partial [Ktedonobacteraceae bacterium]|nr:phenylalanine--tRNA ligase subunit beta [Ktedonobacteraceae bacterium]
AALHLPPDEGPAMNGDTYPPGRVPTVAPRFIVGHSSNGNGAQDYVAVEIADPDLCNRYIGMVIKDVQIGESPKWMQDRLTKAGMRPINNVVDITNYVMLEWGQPLHAFDYDLLVKRAEVAGSSKPTIIVRRARAGEKMTTLDGVERELDESMLLITDTLGPIAIAGVMGGADTEVHPGTRNILLESATFDNISNRRTSQKLRLFSEASHRFTRGIPATLNAIAACRAANLMRDYAGGHIVPGMADNYPVPQVERVVYTTGSDIHRILGMDVKLSEIAAWLQRLEIATENCTALPDSQSTQGDAVFGLHINPGESLLRCTAPWYRLDIQVPADLAEEVARVIGYERINTTLMDDVLPPQRRNLALETDEKIRDILVGCGLQETINYSLTTPENHDRVNRDPLGTAEQRVPFITLVNPLSVKRRVMRRSLLVSALENLAYNYRYTERLAVFEIGRVYLPENGDGVRPKEDNRLSLLLTGPRRQPSVHPDPAGAEPFDFFDLKGILETLLLRMGISDNEIDFEAVHNNPTFGPACAQLKINGLVEGILGELDTRVLLEFDLPTTARVYAAEIEIKPLIKPSWRIQPIRPISNYPPVVEDLAFVVSEEVTASQMLEAIRKSGGSVLSKVELFDVYRGQPIPTGHKSLAYQLTYESLEAPLKENQVVAVRNRIIRHVAESVGGTLRER